MRNTPPNFKIFASPTIRVVDATIFFFFSYVPSVILAQVPTPMIQENTLPTNSEAQNMGNGFFDIKEGRSVGNYLFI